MELEFGESVRVSGRDVWRSGGPAEARLVAAMGGAEWELVAELTTLNGFGQDHDQLRRGLLESATKLVDKTFASPLGNLGGFRVLAERRENFDIACGESWSYGLTSRRVPGDLYVELR